MPLDERKQKVLQAVVDEYVATADPVSSRSIVGHCGLDVSPATLRNEMAELEEMGYLEQPHTSSGRVPSDAGYRIYVDQLMPVTALSRQEKTRLSADLITQCNELETLLRQAAELLASSTGYTSVAITPHLHSSVLDQVRMLMIEPGKVLVIVVVTAGIVRDRLTRMPLELDAETLNKLAKAIETGLAGQRIDEITLLSLEKATERVKVPESLLNQVLYEAYVSIKQADNLEVFLSGVPNLLTHPEFRDSLRAKTVVDALTQNGLIAGYMREDALNKNDDGEFMIRIGQEITLHGMEECSFVSTVYKMGDELMGNIGVIGPRRMSYSNVVSRITFINRMVNSSLEDR